MSSPSDVLEWLESGKEFLAAEQLEAIRKMLKGWIMREREEALARAAILDAQARALDGTGSETGRRGVGQSEAQASNGVGSSNHTHERELDADYDSMTAQDAALHIVRKHPKGIRSADLVAALSAAKNTDRANVYGAISRLVVARLIFKEGDRMAAIYYPREIVS
jgi:hypothetical protein